MEDPGGDGEIGRGVEEPVAGKLGELDQGERSASGYGGVVRAERDGPVSELMTAKDSTVTGPADGAGTDREVPAMLS